MSRKLLLQKRAHSQRRHARVRTNIKGSAKRPRLSVHFSNLNITAQLVDDDKGASLAYVSTVGQKNIGKSMSDKATWVGQQMAAGAKTAKIKRVVFDRGDKPYHGRVAALAQAAREAGLEF